MERHPVFVCSWIGKLNTVKMLIQHKVIYIQSISIKIPMDFCAEIEKPILKFTQIFKGPGPVKQSSKEEPSGRTYIFQYQNLPQSYSNENSVVLAWGYTYRPMD